MRAAFVALRRILKRLNQVRALIARIVDARIRAAGTASYGRAGRAEGATIADAQMPA
jgi:hypothetical protein